MAAESRWRTLSGAELGWNFGGNIGGGYLKARYRRTADGLLFVNLTMLAAADTTFGSPGDEWSFYMPFEFIDVLFDAASVSLGAPVVVGSALAYDSSAGSSYPGICFVYYRAARWFLTTRFGLPATNGAGATVPFTWAAGDQLYLTLVAEGIQT